MSEINDRRRIVWGIIEGDLCASCATRRDGRNGCACHRLKWRRDQEAEIADFYESVKGTEDEMLGQIAAKSAQSRLRRSTGVPGRERQEDSIEDHRFFGTEPRPFRSRSKRNPSRSPEPI